MQKGGKVSKHGRLIDVDALEKDGWMMHRTVQVDKATMSYQTKKPTDFPTIEPEPCEDAVSRNAIIQKLNTMDRYVSEELRLCDTDKKFPKNEVFIVDDVYEEIVENLSSAQPEQRVEELLPDGTLHLFTDTDLSKVNRVWVSQNNTHYGDLYYADEDPKRGKWIPCSERLPEEPFGCLVTVWDTNPVTMDEFENILPYFVGWDGEQWNDADGEQCPFEVVAWLPLPKSYKERREE